MFCLLQVSVNRLDIKDGDTEFISWWSDVLQVITVYTVGPEIYFVLFFIFFVIITICTISFFCKKQ